jgi:circadian clock protein KaiB
VSRTEWWMPQPPSVLQNGDVMSKQTATETPRYKFAVYIARPTRESELALARLRKICDEQVPAEYEIEVFDLRKNPRLASDLNIFATPAIFRTVPAPILKSIGDLSRTDQALLGLDWFH